VARKKKSAARVRETARGIVTAAAVNSHRASRDASTRSHGWARVRPAIR
jgi:hypothetical protein